MSGRIGALAIRPSNGQFILGGAQGGIWLYDPATGLPGRRRPTTRPTLAIGALAVAPSNDAIVYAGTGEGAFSGDSYFGNGVLKSTDGGDTGRHVSGDYFHGVSTRRSSSTRPTRTTCTRRPARPRRRRAARRRPVHSKYGVWESKDGGVELEAAQGSKEQLGATDLEIDPQNPQILYSSFWATRSTRARTAASTGRRP